MIRHVFLLSALTALLALFFSDGPAPAIPVDDYWTGWRAVQRAELAALPRPPAPPEGLGHPIDRFLEAAWRKQGLGVPPVVDDRTFARRVYLDIVGLLPTVEQLERFERDRNPDKRQKLVDHLLGDRDGYAEHWMTYWNDLLRNDEQTNIDGLRKPITGWLFESLQANKPLDLLVAELLNPGKQGPGGYLKGVNWRGRVNASQVPPVQAAQNVSQVFLASSLKCASCHDSFINSWKLKQAYGLASFFAPQNLEMHRCDKGTGQIIAPEFLFPGLGDVASTSDQSTRLRAVARMVTRPKNPRFAKTMVNRLWKRLLGRGLFEPVDDFDSQPASSDLLNWLAYDFMSHDYNVKHTLRLILLSRVYQAPVVEQQPSRKGAPAPPLVGPIERRLTSEQFLDAISRVTGYWPKTAVMNVKVNNPQVRAWRHKKPDALAVALGRPNREQVCTERNDTSTVLQGLELVNGEALAGRLREGAKMLLASSLGRSTDPVNAARALYLRAFGRTPSAAEIVLAQRLLGNVQRRPAGPQERWEDFLWILVLSPEFQFIR
jgi:hypothetical protein